MQRRRFLLGAVSVVFANLLGGCGSGEGAQSVAVSSSIENGSGNRMTGTQAVRSEGLVLQSHEFYRQGSSGGVRGVVENRGDVDLTFVRAKARFFDGSGNRIGGGSNSNGNGLPVGETWQFNTQLLDTDAANVARYQLVVIDKSSSEVSDPFEDVTF